MNSTPVIQNVVGGLIAIIVVAAVAVFAYQGDPTARTLMFTIASAAGVAFIQHKAISTTTESTVRTLKHRAKDSE